MKFRNIKGYPNYLISSCGKIINVNTGKELKGWYNSQGYHRVCLINQGVKRHFYVHRLVAICFCYNPHCYNEVHHVNHDRTNNDMSNLKWVSREENMHYVRNKVDAWVNKQPSRSCRVYKRLPRKKKKGLLQKLKTFNLC